MASVEQVKIESDERGFELHLTTEHGLAVFNVQMVAEQLLSEVVTNIGPWVLEGMRARRERTPFDQGDLGPWPGESPMDYYKRTGDREPLAEQADRIRDSRDA